jgi:hypothetical protein
LHGESDEQSSWTVLEAWTQPDYFPVAGLPALESSTGAYPHGLLDLSALGGSWWLLLVTQQFAPDGTSLEPYIMVVAAPALATLGLVDATSPPRYSYLDFLDDMVHWMIWFSNCLVSKPTPPSTTHSWQQRRPYLIK